MNKMKFSLIGKLMFACAMIVFLGGCTDKVTETVYVDLSLSRYSVAFPVEGGTTSITVATEDSWEAATNASWLKLSYEGDSKLVIIALENEETESVREAEITISTTSCGSATVQVRQEPATAPSLSVNRGSTTVSIDSEGGEFVASVKCDCDWTASLAEAIPNWELTYNVSKGIVSVSAGANSGDTIIGTIVITATSATGSRTEEVEVRQDSRAENPYFQFTGKWLIDSYDCFYGEEWIGGGAYNSFKAAEFDYVAGILSMTDFSDVSGLQSDEISYRASDRTFTFPLGHLCGTAHTGDIQYYMYIVAFNESMTQLSLAESYLVFTSSEDGKTASVSGIDEDYPIIGWVGYNSSYGYNWFTALPYSKAPMSLVKADEETTSAFKTNGLTIEPITELPEDVPAFLPKGFVGEVSGTVAY